jgi:hypothetical protein
VTARERTLAALAAAFAPDRARALVSRVAEPHAAELSAHGARLAARDRRERVAELSAALAALELAGADPAPIARERGAVSGVLGAVHAGGALPPGVRPAMVRLCRERLVR